MRIAMKWFGDGGQTVTGQENEQCVDYVLYHHICSGDVDSVVPVTSTRNSIEAMNLPIVIPWHPWYDHDQVSPCSHGQHRIYSMNLF